MKGEICIVVPFSIKIMIRLTGKLDYTSRSYTYSYMGVCCSLCADAHHIGKPLRREKKKGSKKTSPLPPEIILIMQKWTSVSPLFMSCLTDDAKAYEAKLVMPWWSFDVLLRKQTGGGFAEKWPQVKCVLNETTILCYFLFKQSYHTNNSEIMTSYKRTT